MRARISADLVLKATPAREMGGWTPLAVAVGFTAAAGRCVPSALLVRSLIVQRIYGRKAQA